MTRPGRNPRSAIATAALLTASLVAAGTGAAAAANSTGDSGTAGHGRHRATGNWVSGWQGSPTAGGTFDPASCPADTGLADQTVRDVVPVSVDGDRVRVRVSNAFGAAPLRVGSASVALSARGAEAVRGTVRPLRFSGSASVLVPAGGEALSDPVDLSVQALQRLAVSVYLPEATGPATQHNNSRETNYLAAGDHSADRTPAAFTTPVTCWMFASGVDVEAARRVVGTVVALGDSITDGDQSSIDADARYPDFLARRLDARRGPTLAVSNAGIGGNELLRNRVPELFGVSAAGRLPRDVLAQAGARSVILVEGINDIGAEAARAEDLIQADQQIIAQARAAGLRVYGATLVPFGGSNAVYGADYGTPAGEAERQRLNAWIRTSGAFDAVFDLDVALRDPAHPDRLLPTYDSGDHLHPSDAGYEAMAAAIDVDRLVRDAQGAQGRP
ncbi:SGNH/GDSL hydrolase family protein [Kineococcus rubinsiae]|uniref:SGNH/GDSL hydrolase family protein n=1 Tax=Kineococcus rubinsiae TaxID=2609562 RepID=UPI0014311E28|nr:SGNH/GDSL hydrolase family protein [Kineococcus rubinsiae]NIZ91968.1 SGNH/GDSL hydrolase family protein [Kineococcus rubinsiae]